MDLIRQLHCQPAAAASAVCLILTAAPIGCDATRPEPCTIREGQDFQLLDDGGESRLHYTWAGRDTIVPVPPAWLQPTPAEDLETGSGAEPPPYDQEVTAFHATPDLLGLHLSGYAVASEGSLQLAQGRDLFLLLDPAAGEWLEGRLPLGITQSRYRFMGCWLATQTRFALADVDGNGSCDIGIEETELRCREIQKRDESGEIMDTIEGPCRHRDPTRWYVFRGTGWELASSEEGTIASDEVMHLPWIGHPFGPVDFVLRNARRGIDECQSAPE